MPRAKPRADNKYAKEFQTAAEAAGFFANHSSSNTIDFVRTEPIGNFSINTQNLKTAAQLAGFYKKHESLGIKPPENTLARN